MLEEITIIKKQLLKIVHHLLIVQVKETMQKLIMLKILIQ